MKTKICSKCKIEKPYSEYHKRPKIKSGIVHQCKSCCKKRGAEYRKNNKEKIAVYRKKRYDDNRELELLYGKDYREKNPEKDKARHKKYYDENKDIINEKGRIYRKEHPEVSLAYYEKNKDRMLAKSAKWQRDNPEKVKIRNKKWDRNNKGKVNAKNAKKRAKKLQRTPSYANIEKIKEYYIATEILSHFMGEKYHVDHIIPLQGELVSGFHIETNLQVIPAKENLIKSNNFTPIVKEFNNG